MDSFITERLRALNEIFPGTLQQGIMRDTHGVYAFAIQSPSGSKYYFAAKNSMKGDTISIHKSLLTDAIRFRRAIIMAIKEDFYRFSPHEIKDRSAFENVYHGARMVNFSVSLGHDLLKADAAAKREPDPTLFPEEPSAAPPPSTFEPRTPEGRELYGAITNEFQTERI